MQRSAKRLALLAMGVAFVGTCYLYRERVSEFPAIPEVFRGRWERIPERYDPHIGIREFVLSSDRLILTLENGKEVWRQSYPVVNVIVRTRRDPEVGTALICYGTQRENVCAEHRLQLDFGRELSLIVNEIALVGQGEDESFYQGRYVQRASLR